MEITDEIIAAYVDGTLPEEQLPEVRLYLAEHPDELENVVHLMNYSLGYDDSEEEETNLEDFVGGPHGAIVGANLVGVSPLLGLSAAAFCAPSRIIRAKRRTRHRKVDVQKNLKNFLKELKL